MRHHFTPVRKAIIKKTTNGREDVATGEPLCSVDVIMNSYTHCGDGRKPLRNLKAELPYDLAIPKT